MAINRAANELSTLTYPVTTDGAVTSANIGNFSGTIDTQNGTVSITVHIDSNAKTSNNVSDSIVQQQRDDFLSQLETKAASAGITWFASTTA